MFTENKDLCDYIHDHSSPEDNILSELNRETYLKVLNPRMLAGHIQGKLLEFLSCMLKPKYILEIGTYTGYSAICLAKGLSKGGKLITIEINDEILDYPQKYFEKTGLNDSIEILRGDAIEIIPRLRPGIDLVFLDADKTEYIQYYELVIEKVKKGGFIIADNVLWNGKILGEFPSSDKESFGIHAFNEKVIADQRVEVLMLPIRDGLSLIRKL